MHAPIATRGVIAAAGTALALSLILNPAPARADEQQNRAVRGLDSQLYPRGYGGYTGAGIRVGVHEAGNNIPNYAGNGALQPNSLLPLGNPYLANAQFSVLAQGGVLGPADTVGNHASTVAGCIVATHAQHYGISRASAVLASGFDVPAQASLTSALQASVAQAIHNTQGMALAGTRIINQSWGIVQADEDAGPPAPPPPRFINPRNDGNSLNSHFSDWAASSAKGQSIRDLLIVVAGNEGEAGGLLDYGSPSDAYNSINVSASGRVVNPGAAGRALRYDRVAAYTLSNSTADRSLITGGGRQKTDMIAPGGDPGDNASGDIGPRGTVATPGASGGFFGASGGQVEYFGQFNRPGDPLNGQHIYSSDDRAGVLGLVGTGLTNHTGVTWDTDPLGPTAPRNDNPGIGLVGLVPQYSLSNADAHQTVANAGTSFAAPLVTGAAGNLLQYGVLNAENTDHRVLKAVLMNGANKFSNETGAPLTQRDGVTTWTRAVGAALNYQKPDVIRGGTVTLQVGLDPQMGTGQLDMLDSFVNYASGQQGPGFVADTGYDLNAVAPGQINQYLFTTYGGQFRATLVWDRNVTLLDANANGQWDFADANGNGVFDQAEDLDNDGNIDVNEDANNNRVLDAGEDVDGDGRLDLYAEDFNASGALDPAEAAETFLAQALVDLDLELYRIDPLLGAVLVDMSTSDIDNAEHVWQLALAPGTYSLSVLNQDAFNEDYALAWMIPAPGALALLAAAGALSARRRRT